MAERISALAGCYQVGTFGKPGAAGVTLREIGNLALHQVVAWPDTLVQVGTMLQQHVQADGVAGAGQSCSGATGTMLRIEPLKWWLIDLAPPSLTSDLGSSLDLSHARSRIRISGPEARVLLNLHLPLDLRDRSFAEGAVASSMIHHVGITLWRHASGYELFIPRGFAVSIWQGLVDSARQFGLRID